jgi:hypothetical protein
MANTPAYYWKGWVIEKKSWLHFAHGYTRHAAYFTFQGYQTKIDVTSSSWHKTFFSFILQTNKLGCFALGDTFQMGLIYINKVKRYASNIRKGWNFSQGTNTPAYSYGAASEGEKRLVLLTEGLVFTTPKFNSQLTNGPEKAGVFVPGKPLQPGVM